MTFPSLNHTNIHNRFTAIFLGLPGWSGARRNLLLDFMVQGKITWGRHTDNPAGCHSTQTNQRPTSIIHSPILTSDALPAATLPIYRGLGQASSMLACIRSPITQPTTSKQCIQLSPSHGYNRRCNAYSLEFRSEFSSIFCCFSKSLSHVKLPQIRLSDLPYDNTQQLLRNTKANKN